MAGMTQTAFIGTAEWQATIQSYRDEALRWALHNPDVIDDGLGVLLADALDDEEPDDAARVEVLTRASLLAMVGVINPDQAVIPPTVYLAFVAAILPYQPVARRVKLIAELSPDLSAARIRDAAGRLVKDDNARRALIEAF